MESRIRNFEVVDDRVAEIVRRKSPAERLAMVDWLRRIAREMVRANITRENPDWSAAETGRQVARRISRGAV